MVRVERSVVINKLREQVFDYVTKFDNYSKCIPMMLKYHYGISRRYWKVGDQANRHNNSLYCYPIAQPDGLF